MDDSDGELGAPVVANSGIGEGEGGGERRRRRGKEDRTGEEGEDAQRRKSNNPNLKGGEKHLAFPGF